MFPYYFSSPSDTDYLRALAEERVAREQYAAARRAQEDARQRAARARAARRAYVSPYSSFVNDDDCNDLDLDMDLDSVAYPSRQRPFSYAEDISPFIRGLGPYQQRALMEEQRRKDFLEEQRKRELLEEQRRKELLELERERQRRRLEEERIQRMLQEERQREEAARQKLLEEERLRQRMLLEEEMARRERDRASQQASFEPLLRALGLTPESVASSAEDAQHERLSRQPRVRRPEPSRSPVRQFPFGQTSPATSTPATTIPISIHKESPAPSPSLPKPTEPTPEQVAAAECIQEAYRAYTARKHALKSISSIRKRFLTARAAFVLPTTLDYDISVSGYDRTSTTVTIGATTILPEDLAAASREGVPRLAYTSTNTPLHAYEEELNRILSALDEVESRGDMGVRAARRELARAVEREAERVEGWRAVVWNSRLQQESEGTAVSTEPEVPLATASTEDAVQLAPAQENDLDAHTQVGDAHMETEPVGPISTASDQGMEVESVEGPESDSHQPASEPESASSSSTVPEPPKPKPSYADVVAHRFGQQVVAEPHPLSVLAPAEGELGETTPSQSIVPDADDDDDFIRPPTPALSHGASDLDMDIEEPHEMDTPPLTADAERPNSIDADVQLDNDVFNKAVQEEHLPTCPSEGQQKQLSRPLSLVNTDWHELVEYDMF